ncbi:hypothetical protein XAP412_890017 [Xanthomonas phaseoli pv. phaseoli]|uniref:Transposase n=1 Tax=Xanthomonas campestris pv. phaseoli TaxID=317013 RepID=A0AB38E8B3_XANCH|nr:hypothetical protein XAP6984_920017 [Xanthomonas phaseoli pv. phaseoli]SON91301.1 hypothetical protein XAP412_890017 [Xanthomonas phaseoli pv. phaseoli]SON92887.1 hypothetical protein XAP7430_910019 [Xanthomonas phaseoli pv. phaseoli]
MVPNPAGTSASAERWFESCLAHVERELREARWPIHPGYRHEPREYSIAVYQRFRRNPRQQRRRLHCRARRTRHRPADAPCRHARAAAAL